MKKSYICQCPYCKLGRYCKDKNDYTVMLIYYEAEIIRIKDEINNLKSLGFNPTGLSTTITEQSTVKEKQGLRLSILEGNLEWYEEILYGLRKDNKNIGVSLHKAYK